jgi:hypothetical protein
MICVAPGAKVVSSKRNASKSDDQNRAERIRLERAAPSHISRYFDSASVPDGVNIHSKRYIDLCVETSICEATDAAYKAMSNSGRFSSSNGQGSIADDVRMVIGILREIRAKCVPQEFSAGILLMHLEIMEGLSFSNET